jgi:chromosome segregation ATPase
MAIDSADNVAAQTASLVSTIERADSAAEAALAHSLSAPDQHPAAHELPQHQELCRQLAALRRRLARARSELTDPYALRAELATLAFFARTLREDAERWQATALEALQEIARREAALRREQERLAAKRRELTRRRDALQAAIDRTAAEVADGHRGEWRRTVPVIRLGDALSVSSITVSASKRPFGALRLWLVTLTEDRDRVLVRRD